MRAALIALALVALTSTPVLAQAGFFTDANPNNPHGYQAVPMIDGGNMFIQQSVDAPVATSVGLSDGRVTLPADVQAKQPTKTRRAINAVRRFCKKYAYVVNFGASVGTIMTAIKVLTL